MISLTPAGETIRGIEIYSFDDFLRQGLAGEETAVGLSTVFYPMHRVERAALDEPSGTILSLVDRFFQKVGLSLLEHRGIESSVIPSSLG